MIERETVPALRVAPDTVEIKSSTPGRDVVLWILTFFMVGVIVALMMAVIALLIWISAVLINSAQSLVAQ